MQTASDPLKKTIMRNVAIRSNALLIAEWNYNRYAAITSISNSIPDGDEVLFPIAETIKAPRPHRGLLKARASSRYDPTPEGYTTTGYTDLTTSMRSYTASVDSIYKYWTSPTLSSSVFSGNGYPISSVSPSVVYGKLALQNADSTTATIYPWVNKLYIAIENTLCNPASYSVQTSVDGLAWITVATNPIIDANGKILLWRQSNGTWTNTPYYDAPIQILGLRLNVTSVSGASQYFSLIEIGCRLEQNLTAYLQDYSVINTMSEYSLVTPLGTCSANTGSINLSNTDGIFNGTQQLLDSGLPNILCGIIDKNIEFRMDIGINTVEQGGPGYEYIREFTMLSDGWSGMGTDSVSVEISDDAIFLQQAKPNSALYTEQTVGEIVWRLCDSIGYNNYHYDIRADDPSTLTPYFWADGKKFVWDYFKELAQSTQTAIYFDEYNVLQIKTRNSAMDITRPVDWTFDYNSVTSGDITAQGRNAIEIGKLPDIESLKQGGTYEANQVNITYSPTDISDYNNGYPLQQIVWQPTDTPDALVKTDPYTGIKTTLGAAVGGSTDVVLRASALTASMTSVQDYMFINREDAAYWPYNAIIQMEGEFMRVTSKTYSYVDASGAFTSAKITSLDAKKALDKLNPDMSWRNQFTGGLYVNRGIWNTTPATHSVDISGWNMNRISTLGAGTTAWNGGLIHNLDRSSVTLQTNASFGYQSWYACTIGNSTDVAPLWYGTRLKFPTSGYTYGAAGMVISAGTNDSGYYVELIRTASITSNDRALYTNELCFYIKRSDGSYQRVGPNGNKGTVMGIVAGAWYDMDIKLETYAGNRVVTVMINGIEQMSVTFAAALVGEPTGGRFGVFTRGFSAAEFEYVYASTLPVSDSFDQTGYFDKITGGYQSSQWDREWVYSYRHLTQIRKAKKVDVIQRYNSRVFSEFGPIAHEVREYNIKFTSAPCVSSFLYMSNDYQVICPEYTPTPFGAKFVLANTSRINAIVNGDDSTTFGSGNSVSQVMMIYGRLVTPAAPNIITVKNDDAIRRRGLIEVNITSPWTQTASAANALGEWIIANWSMTGLNGNLTRREGQDEVELTVNGNPLIQLGDRVALNYQPEDFHRATHQYFVIGVSNNYDGGLVSSLTLRRAGI